MKKRIKYNNGGAGISFSKGIFEFEGNAKGNKKQKTVEGTASISGKGYRASVGRGYDTQSGKSQNYSLEKQLPNRSSVGFKKNKTDTGMYYSKKTNKGSNIRFGVSRKPSPSSNGSKKTLEFSMSFSKPI